MGYGGVLFGEGQGRVGTRGLSLWWEARTGHEGTGFWGCVEGRLELEAVIGHGWRYGLGGVLGNSEPQWANGCGSQSWQWQGQEVLYNYLGLLPVEPGSQIPGLRFRILHRLLCLWLRVGLLWVPVWQIPELYLQRSTLCLCQPSRPSHGHMCAAAPTDTQPWAGLQNGFISQRLRAVDLAWVRVVYLSCWAFRCV